MPPSRVLLYTEAAVGRTLQRPPLPRSPQTPVPPARRSARARPRAIPGGGAAGPTHPGHRRRATTSRSSGVLVQRPVAALGRRQPSALRRDRAALDAVGVVD